MDDLVLEIKDLSLTGAGVAREASGRVVFVPYTVPGDRVRVKLIESDKRYAQAELLEIIDPSADRVLPRCTVFGRCGGCQWQHVSYPRQWKSKIQSVQHALKKVGAQGPEDWDEFPAEQIWEYRNRVQLRGKAERLGFYARGSHDLVPIERCEISRAEINALLPKLREQGRKQRSPFKVEVEVHTDGTVTQTWNSRHAAGGFRQVHDEQNRKLQKWVAEMLLEGASSPRILDLFGGAGNLSLPLSSKASEIDCVDISAPAEKSQNIPSHFRFHRTEVAPWLIRFASAQKSLIGDLLAILDPPREGLASSFLEILTSFERLKVSKFILVGCSPDTWARDLSRWTERRWKIEKLAAFDFFPQTSHVECAAVLKPL